ncbi:AMP-binding protein, partial [Xanthomonas sp. 1678]|uniref:AMP-binding protein n=1 Tax=Xanthomonas sp. 1678 TaxID=3158788 RepID=UPI00286444FF|nr:acyl-CoA synthetase (AMP-forming)/AMP-acid ligase II/acyl carrier protein [Xanthomonas translucens]
MTFLQLHRRAQTIAAALQARIAPGDRVLVACPPSLDYIVAFFACAYAGAVAVPVTPPLNARRAPRVQGIARDAQARWAIAPGAIVDRLGGSHADDAGVQWLAFEALDGCGRAWQRPSLGVADIAFLQYTSGSTGDPKGVMVTHRNIMANAGVAAELLGLQRDDVVLSWLPPYHDMGLIGAILYPLFARCQSIHFAPAAFLASPMRWLQALSDFRATVTVAPNFAYQLCADRQRDMAIADLDLHRLRIAINGAERVRPETQDAFVAAFASCGMRRDAFVPAYGMAETTLLVAADSALAGRDRRPPVLRVDRDALRGGRVQVAEEGLAFASVGRPECASHRLALVDPETCTRVDNGAVGELWVQGASVAAGYWRRPELSGQTFRAALRGETGEWLRSGDLAFVADDWLYICGRIKEVMIIAGRNVYPQDVEQTVECLDAAFLRNGCVVFSMEDSEPARVVVVQEVDARTIRFSDALVARVRRELSMVHALPDVEAIVFLRKGHLPRTSSGKPRRLHCRELYQSDALNEIWAWRMEQTQPGPARDLPPSPVGDAGDVAPGIAALWQDVLGLAEVSIQDDFLSLGGQSIEVATLIARIRDRWQVELVPQDFFDHRTPMALAEHIVRQRMAVQPILAMPILPADRSQALPLSWSQQRLWFLDRLDAAAGAAYHIAAGLQLDGDLDLAALQAALDRIVARHEALRTCFASEAGVPRQVIAPASVGFALTQFDFSDQAPEAQQAALAQLDAEEARQAFDLERGPLIRGSLVRLSPRRHVLLLTQHHIVSDGWSMGVLIRELRTLYTAFHAGEPDPLPPLPVQYPDYALWQRQWLQGEALEAQLAYWRQDLADAPRLLELPWDRPRPAVQRYRGGRLPVQVSA